MKTSVLQYLFGLIFLFSLSNVHAQINTEQIRYSEPISYFVSVPYSKDAEFTWTITGGTIIGHTSPYTAIGADTIRVKWNNQNKNSANFGSLKVLERINWSGSEFCESEETRINIESWVQPAVIVDKSSINVCAGDPIVFPVRFQGKADYRFKWKLYTKENPDNLLEDHSQEFVSCTDSIIRINISAIENLTDSVKFYVFEIVEVQDSFNDNYPGDISRGMVIIQVHPYPHTGILQSNKHLKRR